MQLLSTADISRFLLAATLLLAPALSAAAEPSATDLRRMEEQVAKQTAESERLAQEAKQINQEIDTISRKMIRYANLIQNNEEKISSMEAELQQLQTELNAAEAEFSLEDENLIKTLAALQNLALKPTESLFVQPLTPVEIIRSAMLLRETVPYLEQNAQRIKIKLEQIDKQKQKVETQFNKIVAQKKLLEQEHDELAALSKKKSTLRNSIEQQSAAAKKKVSKLASQAQDLRDLLGKLEAERLKKQQEEERRRLAEEQRRKKQEEERLQTVSASAKEKTGEKNARRRGGKASDHVEEKVARPAAPGAIEQKADGLGGEGGKGGEAAQKARDEKKPQGVAHGNDREAPRKDARRKAPDEIRGERSRRESAEASESDREKPAAKRSEGRARRHGGRTLPSDARHDVQSAAMSASTSSGFVAQLVTNRTTWRPSPRTAQ